jgi:hypothetical protein
MYTLLATYDTIHCVLLALLCMPAEWVEGVKVSSIDVTTPEGRSKLATLQATLLNSYLTQLLESGFLHAGTVFIVHTHVYIHHIVGVLLCFYMTYMKISTVLMTV